MAGRIGGRGHGHSRHACHQDPPSSRRCDSPDRCDRGREYSCRRVLVCPCTCGTRGGHPADRGPSREQHPQKPPISGVLVLSSLSSCLLRATSEFPWIQRSSLSVCPPQDRIEGEIVIDMFLVMSITISSSYHIGVRSMFQKFKTSQICDTVAKNIEEAVTSGQLEPGISSLQKER